MTHLVIIGPQLLYPYNNIIKSSVVFQRQNINPLVAEMYHAAYRSADRLGVHVSFPEVKLEKAPHELWFDAVLKLHTADAAFAVFVGRSRAIPVEAGLARLMNLPLVVAAIDTDFIHPFLEEDVPVIDADPSAVEQAIERLFRERPSGSGIGPGGGAPLPPPLPQPVPLHY